MAEKESVKSKKTSLFLVDCKMHKEEEGRSVGDGEGVDFRVEIRIDNSNTEMKSRCRVRIINEKKRILYYM
jgi:hypothetical protein